MSPMWKWRRKRPQQSRPAQQFTGNVSNDDKIIANLTRRNGTRNLLILCPDGQSYMFPNDHPNFDKAVALAIDSENPPLDSESYRKLFDVEESVRDLFGLITDRVRVAQGVVYFDEKEVHNAVTEQIIAFMDSGRQDFAPLAKFMEQLSENPNERSRDSLFEWLEKQQLAIDDEGHVIGFKGVDRNYKPSRVGPGIVDGVPVDESKGEKIVYNPGSIVSIPRDRVDESLSHCSIGLHIGTRSFADRFQSGYGQGNGGKTVEVRFSPRDVVSVDKSNREKIRVCRLRVVGDAPPAEHFEKALRVGV
jgi:hypothetical protein